MKIDDEAARASPGVLAIYYAKDVPGTSLFCLSLWRTRPVVWSLSPLRSRVCVLAVSGVAAAM